MAEIVVSPLIKLIYERLYSKVIEKYELVKGVDEEIEKLLATLKRIQAVLTDAEKREVTQEAVQLWLKELKDVAYDADDTLDEFTTKSLMLLSEESIELAGGRDSWLATLKQVLCFFSLRCFKQVVNRNSIANKMKEIRKRIDVVLDEGLKLKLQSEAISAARDKNLKIQERVPTDSFLIEQEIFGRDVDRCNIIQRLLSSDQTSGGHVVVDRHPCVIPIVGMGGIGKTTLAQLAYNDNGVHKHFEPKMWVCVSDNFDVRRLIREIIESITKERCDDLAMDLLKQKLREKIERKCYLLVLDDAWDGNEGWWDSLESVLACGANGSKIIVTTRNDKVAKMMGTDPYYLKGISEEDCWTLFERRAFRNEVEVAHQNLKEIGKEIVKKCGGIPLAAKALGSLMFSKREENEWLYIRESEVWTLPDEFQKGILPALQLSYTHLPSHLKQCFAFCSVFPKDHLLQKETLIQLWAAQGFICSSGGPRSLIDIGNEYFNELLWGSFFQDIEKDEFGGIKNCKVHDLIHDLAQSIAGDECITLSSDCKKEISKQTRHLSLSGYDFDERECQAISTSSKLRTLTASKSYISGPPINLILSFKSLRALTINYSLDELPPSLCDLIHLRYLDIEKTEVEELPTNFTNLRNLQTLKLCSSLKRLPQHMSCLKELMHLGIDPFGSLRKIPPKIGQLTFLRTLPLFIVGKDNGCGIGELCCLDLHGYLRLCNIKNVTNVQEAKEANLMTKANLSQLNLEWSHGDAEIRNTTTDNGVDTSDIEEVFENLQPNRKLQKFGIDQYPCVQFPKWLMDYFLPTLTYIELKWCTRCRVLPPFSKFPFLEKLSLLFIHRVSYLRNHKGSKSGGYPKLKYLNLEGLYSLKDFSDVDEKEVMPCLEDLEVKNCPQLTSLPNLPSIHSLQLNKTDSAILSSIASLTSVVKLKIASFKNVDILPRGILERHYALESLIIEDFSSLKSLTSELANLTSLKSLEIAFCDDLTCLSPLKMDGLTSLQELTIKSCTILKYLPSGMQQHLLFLRKISIKYLPRLIAFPEDLLQHVPNLEYLEITGCHAMTSLFSIAMGGLTSLKILKLRDCQKLTCLPSGMQHLSSLKELHIELLPELSALPTDVEHLPNLENTDIKSCDKLTGLPEWLGKCQQFKSLRICYCKHIKSLPANLRTSPSSILQIVGCPLLER